MGVIPVCGGASLRRDEPSTDQRRHSMLAASHEICSSRRGLVRPIDTTGLITQSPMATKASGWASALRATSARCPRSRRQPSVYTAVTSRRLKIDIDQGSEIVNAIPFKKVAGPLRVPSAQTRKALLFKGCGTRSVPAPFNN